MDIGKIIFECLLILKVILEGLDNNSSSIMKMVALLIIYIVTKLMYYYIDDERMKGLLLIGGIAFLFWVSSNGFNEDMYIFIYINIFQLVKRFLKKGIILAGIGAFMYAGMTNITDMKTQSFFAVFSIAIFYYMENVDRKLLENRSRIDNLEDEEYKLQVEKIEAIEKMKNIQKIAKIEERNIISQNLHDSIGHTIAGSLMQLQALKIIIKDDRGLEIIERVIGELKNGIEEIRHILRKMKPHDNERGVNQMKKLCVDMEDKGFKVILKYGCTCDMSVKVWEVININVKEAFTNILKYSTSDEVHMEFKEMRGFIRIEIKNQGQGDSKIKKGLGMRGMEERLRDVGGNLIVDNREKFSLIQIIPKEEK